MTKELKHERHLAVCAVRDLKHDKDVLTTAVTTTKTRLAILINCCFRLKKMHEIYCLQKDLEVDAAKRMAMPSENYEKVLKGSIFFFVAGAVIPDRYKQIALY